MTFDEAINGCKLGEFVKVGLPVPELVVHIGANDGYEIPFYLDMGAKKVIAIEPDPRAFRQLYDRFGQDNRVLLYNFVAGKKFDNTRAFLLMRDSHGSSILYPHSEVNCIVESVTRDIGQRPARFVNHLCASKVCGLVIDVQGAELEVLAGIGNELDQYDYAVVEVSAKPEWIGSHYGQSVLDYTDAWGFRQYKPSWWVPTYGDVDIPSHDDILLYNNNASISSDVRRKLCNQDSLPV